MNIKNKPKLSILVCTYNRDYVLEECLKSLVNQTSPKNLYEVIIVDNNSTDNTKDIAYKYSKENNNFLYVKEVQVGLSIARNTGLSFSKASYVAFIDDDAKADDKWVEMIIKVIDEQKPDIIGGPIFPYYKGMKPIWYKDIYGSYSIFDKEGWVTEELFFSGSNIIFKKKLLESYGGFNPSLGMHGKNAGYHEETAIQIKARKDGKKIFYSTNIKTFHLVSEERKNIIFYFFNAYKSGKDSKTVWEIDYNAKELVKFPELLDEIFLDLEKSLKKRPIECTFPENYVIENTLEKIINLGALSSYCQDLSFKERTLETYLKVNNNLNEILGSYFAKQDEFNQDKGFKFYQIPVRLRRENRYFGLSDIIKGFLYSLLLWRPLITVIRKLRS